MIDVSSHDNGKIAFYAHRSVSMAIASDGSAATLEVSGELVDLAPGLAELHQLAEFLAAPEIQRLMRLHKRPIDDKHPDPTGAGELGDWLQQQLGDEAAA